MEVCDTWSLQSSNCLLPSFVFCLSCLLYIQLCRGLIFVVKDAEIGGGGCFDDRGEASLQEVLREKACPSCVLDHCLNARFGCDESSQVCWTCDVLRSLEPDSGLACAECRLRHTVLRETREEPFERPLPKLVINFCSPLFLKDCVTVNSQDVVNAP